MDQLRPHEEKISVIIPAYNEAVTIGPIIRAARQSPLVGEVIVVDDGSDDETANVAARSGASVVRNSANTGKAAAMDRGVARARYDVLCFLDADILSFTPRMLERIVLPVLRGTCGMFVGIRGRKLYFLNRFLHFFPIVGGERALRREIWQLVPDAHKKKFQIEVALNYFCKKHGKRMGFAVIPRLSQVIKEKMGLAYGLGGDSTVPRLGRIAVSLYVFRSLRTPSAPGKPDNRKSCLTPVTQAAHK